MALAFVAAAHYDALSSASVVVPVPTGTAANDLMLCFLKNNPDGPNSVPSGWAELGSLTSLSRNWAFYWKLATGSEPADYTWGYAVAGRAAATMVSYRGGFDTADPIDVVSNTAYATSDTILRAASMSVAAINSAIIFAGGYITTTAQSATPPTNPGTFVEDVDFWLNADSRCVREFASLTWSGSGATGNMDATMTITTIDKHAFAVALNPAAGGTPMAPMPMPRRIFLAA
jgi:hypothetical protein